MSIKSSIDSALEFARSHTWADAPAPPVRVDGVRSPAPPVRVDGVRSPAYLAALDAAERAAYRTAWREAYASASRDGLDDKDAAGAADSETDDFAHAQDAADAAYYAAYRSAWRAAFAIAVIAGLDNYAAAKFVAKAIAATADERAFAAPAIAAYEAARVVEDAAALRAHDARLSYYEAVAKHPDDCGLAARVDRAVAAHAWAVADQDLRAAARNAVDAHAAAREATITAAETAARRRP